MSRIKRTKKVTSLKMFQMPSKTEDEIIFTMMKLNMLVQASLEAMDDLEGSPLYKHEFKRSAKAFKSELEVFSQQNFNKVFELREDMAMYYLVKVEQASELFASMDFEELSTISSLLAWYKIDPEKAKDLMIQDLNKGVNYLDRFDEKDKEN